MTFWKLAYDRGWISPDKEVSAVYLRVMVISETNPFGQITSEEYKLITGKDF